MNPSDGTTSCSGGRSPCCGPVRRMRHSEPVFSLIRMPPTSGAILISPKSTTYREPSGPKAQCEGRSKPAWGSIEAGPWILLVAKSTILPVRMSIRTTLNPEGVAMLLRVVMGERSPNIATKASPSKPKTEILQKSTPFAILRDLREDTEEYEATAPALHGALAGSYACHSVVRANQVVTT